MPQSGLEYIKPHRTDFDFLEHARKSFGAVNTAGLPENFSIYDGQEIPNQSDVDLRFNPFLPPLPMGCTGETAAFESGLQDGQLYNPKWIYDNTPPGGGGGRQMRDMLQFLIDHGPAEGDGDTKRKGYFNVYGKGEITDYDAVKIALWVNQNEKRGVYVGSWFYPEFVRPVQGSGGTRIRVGANGIVPVPSFNTKEASLHCWLITGWKTIDGVEYLEGLTWQGPQAGFKGIEYFSYAIYNALMQQTWTGAFTISKFDKANPPLTLGIQVIVDHLVYFILSLFKVTPSVTPPPNPAPTPTPPVKPAPQSVAQRIVEQSEQWLGQDPTPDDKVADEVSCVYSLVKVIRPVIALDTSLAYTPYLVDALAKDKRFKTSNTVKPGCIVVYPTVGNNKGHALLAHSEFLLASNNSIDNVKGKKGFWTLNYTIEQARKYFVNDKKLKEYIFTPVDIV